MRLAIDLDGVVANFTKRYGEIINKLYPGAIPEGYDPPDWDWTDKLTPEMTKAAWEEIVRTSQFWLSLDTYPENAQALHAFINAYPSVEVYYVTARAETADYPVLLQTRWWLEQRGLMTYNTSIIRVEHGKDKGRVLRALAVDYSVDDNVDNVINSMNDDPFGEHYLLARSWNVAHQSVLRGALTLLDFFSKIEKEMLALGSRGSL